MKINNIKLFFNHYQLIAILFLLLSGNFLLRFIFELHMQSVPYYFDQLQLNTNNVPWYYYMIPSNSSVWGGTWASLGIGLLPIFHKIIGNTATYLLLNFLFIAVAYVLSWYAFRSRILTFTVGLCTSFTTINEHVYDNGSLVGLYIPLIFCLLNMFTIFKLFERDKPEHYWWGLWVITLLLYIASVEGWVEYYATILVISPFVYLLLEKNEDWFKIARLIKMLVIMTLIFVLFLYFKFKFTYASNPGEEHDLIINYGHHYGLLILEDLISNFFTFFYTTIITYLPAQLTFSNALMYYGPQTIMNLQNGYDSPYAQLVAINALTLWRFYAGVCVSIFVYYFWRVAKRLFTAFDSDYFFLFLFMGMVLIGSPAHMLVKYRAMHAVPWLSYQTFIGQIGIILLMGYGLLMLHKSGRTPLFIWTVTILIWSSIVVSAFTKHAFYQTARAYGNILSTEVCPA